LLFSFFSNINFQSLLKKINILLENPKVILLHLSFNSSKDNEKDDNTNNINNE
jgi:hypothetical protein